MKHIVYVSYQFELDTIGVHDAVKAGTDTARWGTGTHLSVSNINISASPYNDSPSVLAPPPAMQVESTVNAVADVPAQESAS